MQFQNYFAFLLLIPWALAAWRLLRRSTQGGLIFAPASHRLPVKTAGWRAILADALPFIFLLGLLLLIVAAARPRTQLSKVNRNLDAIAIEMVVDVSGSMEALDLSERSPSGEEKLQTRLDVVKDTFAAFIKERSDDLIGLVTFGGYASTRSPLTADHEALLLTLKGVEIPSQKLDAQGRPVSDDELLTAIGDGLSTALARVVDAEPKTKIVVLLSDGESNTGIITPMQAADAAKKLKIKVYTICIGKSGVAPFRTRDIFGRETIAQARVNVDEATLRKIAETTGGEYYNILSPDALKQALAAINQLETTRVQREVYHHYNENFLPWLTVGAGLAVLALLLNVSLLRRTV